MAWVVGRDPDVGTHAFDSLSGPLYCSVSLGNDVSECRACGVPKDYSIARKLYQRAAAQGYAPAQARLGELFSEGLGVSKDARVAIEWYRKAPNSEAAEQLEKLNDVVN